MQQDYECMEDVAHRLKSLEDMLGTGDDGDRDAAKQEALRRRTT